MPRAKLPTRSEGKWEPFEMRWRVVAVVRAAGMSAGFQP